MAGKYVSLFINSFHRISSFHVARRFHSDSVSKSHEEFSERTRKLFKKCSPSLSADFPTWFRVYRAALGPNFMPSSFSRANLDVSPFVVSKDGRILNFWTIPKKEKSNAYGYYVWFSHLFHEGLENAKKILEHEPTSMPETVGDLHKSLKVLDGFLRSKDYHEYCLRDLIDNKKTGIYSDVQTTALLVNHLLEPLSADTGERCSVVSSVLKGSVNPCPCSEDCGQIVLFGNTYLGSPYLWYGNVDILTFPSGRGGPVITEIAKGPVDTDLEMDSVDWTRDEHLRSPSYVSQMTAKTVMISNYQKKVKKESGAGSITTLIPAIIMTNCYFDIYLYDSENDILLRNYSPLPIFRRKYWKSEKPLEPQFDLDSVLILWLAMNHLLLQPKFPSSHLAKLRHTCGIKKPLEDAGLMDIIQDSLKLNSRFYARSETDEDTCTCDFIDI